MKTAVMIGGLACRLVLQQGAEIHLSAWQAASLTCAFAANTASRFHNFSTLLGVSWSLELTDVRDDLDSRTDLYAVVEIAVPAELSDRERELFEALAEASTFKAR